MSQNEEFNTPSDDRNRRYQSGGDSTTKASGGAPRLERRAKAGRKSERKPKGGAGPANRRDKPECGSSGECHPKPRQMDSNSYRVRFVVSKELERRCRDLWTISVEQDAVACGCNLHATLAVERELARRILVGLALGAVPQGRIPKFLNVGGTDREVYHHVRGVAMQLDSICPATSTADVGMAMTVDPRHRVTLADWANSGPMVHDVWIGCQSLYYLSIQEIIAATCVGQKVGFVAVHNFDGDAKTLFELEGRWEAQPGVKEFTGINKDGDPVTWVEPERRITMRVAGGFTYEHGALDWMHRRTGFHISSDATHRLYQGEGPADCWTLSWRLERVLETVAIYRFNVCDSRLALSPPPVLLTMDAVRTERSVAMLTGQIEQALSLRPIDSHAAAIVARVGRGIGEPVAPGVLSSAVQRAMASMPVLADGLCRVRNAAKGLERYNAALQAFYEPVRWYYAFALRWWPFILVWAALMLHAPRLATLIGVVFVSLYRVHNWWAGLPSPLCWWVPLPGIPAMLVECVLDQWWQGTLLNIILEALINGPSVACLFHLAFGGFLGAVAHLLYNGTIFIEDVCCAGRTLSPMAKGASIDVTRADKTCVGRFDLQCRLFYIPTCFPVLPRRCWHNDVIGLRNRVLADFPKSKPGLWRDLSVAFARTIPYGRVQVMTGEEWLEHQDAARRRRYEDFIDPFDPNPRFKVRVMTKYEKTMKAVVHGINPDHRVASAELDFDLFDPRIISIRDPTYQVVFGPVAYSVSKFFRTSRGVDSEACVDLCYCPGMNSEDFSRWFTKVYRVGDFIYSCDFSRFDAHVGREALEAQYYIFRHLTKTKIGLEGDLETAGTSTCGVSYSVAGTRKSGNSDTTVGNTLLNMMMWWQLKRINPSLRVAVMGDDSLALSREPLCAAENFFLKYGFEIKLSMTRDPRMAEFCAMRCFLTDASEWWWVYKPGRCFSKIGFAVRPPGRGWERNVALVVAHYYAGMAYFQDVARLLCESVGFAVAGEFQEWVKHQPVPIANAYSILPSRYTPRIPASEVDSVYGCDCCHLTDSCKGSLPWRLDSPGWLRVCDLDR